MLTGMLSGGLIVHGIAYLELPPSGPGTNPAIQPYMQYMCTNTTDFSLPMYACGKVAWCNNLNQTGLKVTSASVNYEASKYNLYNWWTKFEISCKPSPNRAVSLVATIALLGLGISCLFLPRMGDIYGRKPIYIFALSL